VLFRELAWAGGFSTEQALHTVAASQGWPVPVWSHGILLRFDHFHCSSRPTTLSLEARLREPASGASEQVK